MFQQQTAIAFALIFRVNQVPTDFCGSEVVFEINASATDDVLIDFNNKVLLYFMLEIVLEIGSFFGREIVRCIQLN